MRRPEGAGVDAVLYHPVPAKLRTEKLAKSIAVQFSPRQLLIVPQRDGAIRAVEKIARKTEFYFAVLEVLRVASFEARSVFSKRLKE